VWFPAFVSQSWPSQLTLRNKSTKRVIFSEEHRKNGKTSVKVIEMTLIREGRITAQKQPVKHVIQGDYLFLP